VIRVVDINTSCGTKALMRAALSRGLGFISAMALLGACNSEQAIETDWIHTPEPTPTSTTTPKPTPTTTPTPTPTGTTNPADLYIGPAELQKYVVKFVDDAKIQSVDVLPEMNNPKLTIQIGSLNAWGSSVIGLCETSGSMRRVTFDPDFWNAVSETQRELLAHHELGHCVLYRAHRSTVLPSGAYASIMYPIIMSSSTYTNNYNYYQQELFSQTALDSSPGFIEAVTHVCGLEDL